MNGHAMVPRDGYMVPLIGIPQESAEQVCDVCGQQRHMLEMELHDDKAVCRTCREATS